jgi:5-formyltetrahydrofolate cyclo-ligase
MDKRQLREKYRKIRSLMGPRTIEEDSITICRKAYRQVDWSVIKTVCVYTPVAGLNEVDINPLIAAIEYKHPDVKIRKLGFSKNEKIPRAKFDLIIVPMLAFDSKNHRLGWGGGFYDRFLAGQPQALKIGVCFYNGFVKKGLPAEAHDIPLDQIITEV